MRILRGIIILLILLLQIILLNFVEAEHNILETTIKNGNEEIHLRWQKTQQFLANVHLPVWLAEALHIEPPRRLLPDFVEDNIGEFLMYHDLRKSSAVVYFKKLGALYGVVDTRYIIDGIPMSELHLTHSIGPYVKLPANMRGRPMHLRTTNMSITYNEEYYHLEEKSTMSKNSLPFKKRFRSNQKDQQAITVLYPELLIIVPSDIVEMTKKTKGPNYISIIIRDHIVMFNAIDMMMGKLSTRDIKMHLNIAGILIDHRKVFPFRVINPTERPSCPGCSKKIYAIDADRAIANFKMFLQAHKVIFTPHSFDFYFAASTKLIYSNDEFVEGVSYFNIFYNERLSAHYYNHLQGLMIQRGRPYDYVTASHEIGHLLGIEHDPYSRKIKPSVDEECNAVMQVAGAYCSECLKWTDKSVMELRNFVKENRNHCFLLNKPRSLHPYNHVMRTLSPVEQCRCHGFEPRSPTQTTNFLERISPSRCNKKLLCALRNFNTPMPIDGTPCGDDKACWNLRCKKVQIEL